MLDSGLEFYRNPLSCTRRVYGLIQVLCSDGIGGCSCPGASADVEGTEITMRAIRIFLLVQGAAFVAAALTHFGVLTSGYEHDKAGTAESVIGIVLLAGLVLTALFPSSTRAIGIAAQGFALLGTAVGIFTIAIGVGPQTTPDIVFHIVIVITLLFGLVVAVRAPRAGSNAYQRS
jgi:hypothetical protein